MAKVKCNLPPAPEPTRAYHEHKTYTDIVSVHVEAMVPKVHRHRIFTNAEKSEIFEMREMGLPYSFIARHYNTTSDTIRHIVCRENKKRAESAATLTAQTKKATNR
jgi:hypothetical protein